MTRISDMTVLSSLPSSGAFVPVVRTGSTTNYQYDLSKLARAEALFVNASALTVPTDSDFVQTTGYSALDKGAAIYVSDAAVDAAYVAAHPRSSFISANSRGFRLSAEQDFTPAMFGAVEDGTTDDNAAIAAMQAYQQSVQRLGYGYSPGQPRALVRFGAYYQTAPIDLHAGSRLEGESGSIYGGGGSVLTYAASTSGIRAQFVFTSGDSTYDNTLTTTASQGFDVGHLTLKSAGGAGNHDGIRVKAPGHIHDMEIEGFARAGIYGNASLSDTTVYGNTSHTQVNRVSVQNCGGDGIHCEGVDGSIWNIMGCSAIANGGYGFYDGSAYGALIIGGHTAGNTLGGYHTDVLMESAHPTLINCYEEGGQPASTFGPGTLRVNGNWLAASTGGGYVYASGNRVRVNALGCDGAADFDGTEFNIGRRIGAAADTTVNFNTTNQFFGYFLRYNTDGSLAATDGYLWNIFGTVYLNGVGDTHLRKGGSDIVVIGSGGADLASGKVLSVAGTQVVGARGAAVADAPALTSVNATNAAGVPTQAEFNAFVAEFNKLRTDLDATRVQLNTALARLRAATGHGLVA